MSDRPGNAFPFAAVVGQDDAKLALRLAAIDPLIGGVLLRGQKGSAKTTLARGLAALLDGAPFVDLPLGATEDRVVGTLDTRAALTGGEIRFEPGLLAAADGGVLYVDEINLLPDHLVDVLLDVAVSGHNVVERDGVSHRHPARFVLVGSMNPEEGELRPQFLDRFGLCVDVTAPTAVADRVEVVRRRLHFDSGGVLNISAEAAPSSDIGSPDIGSPNTRPSDICSAPADAPASPGVVGDDVLDAASRLAVAVGAEGLRADLTLCRAAAALAASDGRGQVTVDDVARVAPLVLAHRTRRGPFDPPVASPEALAETVRDTLDRDDADRADFEPGTDSDPGADDSDWDISSDADPDPGARPGPASDAGSAGDEGGPTAGDNTMSSGASVRPFVVDGSVRRPPLAPPGTERAPRGRAIGDALAGAGDAISVLPTVRAVAARRAGLGPDDPSRGVDAADLRTTVRARPRSRVVVLCVDLSGSMGAPARAAAAAGTVLGLLTDAYERRDKVGLVTFRGDEASVVLSPTGSIEVARNRLDGLVTGGATPLALGLQTALRTAQRSTDDHTDALVAVLTDGRATGAGGFDAAVNAAGAIARSDVQGLVLDCEHGTHRLGLAVELAAAMGAAHVPVSDLGAGSLTRAVRAAADRSR